MGVSRWGAWREKGAGMPPSSGRAEERVSRQALLAACANLGLQVPGQERPEAPRCGAAQDEAAVTEEGSLVGAPFPPLAQADRGTWASAQGASQSCDLNGTKDGLQGPLV